MENIDFEFNGSAKSTVFFFLHLSKSIIANRLFWAQVKDECAAYNANLIHFSKNYLFPTVQMYFALMQIYST